jgi:uncharacterized membrane protein HdeD (DUF308 family)
MPNIKINWGEVFLGTAFLFAGGICILVPAIKLQDSSLVAMLILGVMLFMRGVVFIFTAMENLRLKRREEQLTKDKIEQTKT